jgi:hypothetical protein
MPYPNAAWEEAMTVQEVMLKALSGELHWLRARQQSRTCRRQRKDLEERAGNRRHSLETASLLAISDSRASSISRRLHVRAKAHAALRVHAHARVEENDELVDEICRHRSIHFHE